MAEPFRLASPFRRVVAIRQGDTITIAGGVDVFLPDVALAQLGDRIALATHITVRVTGPVTRIVWATPFTWSSIYGSPVTAFKLINESTIYGKGGNGGRGGTISNFVGPGGNAGPAIELHGWTLSIDNASGNIWGGGGAGGGGGLGSGGVGVAFDNASATCAGGGGGGGASGGAILATFGGTSFDTNPSLSHVRTTVWQGVGSAIESIDTLGPITQGSRSETTDVISTDGGTGGLNGPGAGGVGSVASGDVSSIGGDGGSGGGFGEAGQAGTDGFTNGTDTATAEPGGAGGAAGKAIDLAGGTVIWLAGNEPARVKGPVS